MSRYVSSIKKPPRAPTLEEQSRLLRLTGQRAGSFRDHVIIALALGTGLRLKELLGLNVGDRGRNAGFPAPPAQIRTYSFPVYGSYLGCMAKKRTFGYSCKILGLGNQ